MAGSYSTSEYVTWAYRLLLGREPENPDAVASWPNSERREIVARFIRSAEFLDQHPGLAGDRDLWVIAELANGTRFWVRPDEAELSRAVIGGGYRPLETAFVRRYVKRGMNAVDIGSGIGWFAINMAALVGPAGHVDAFEPREDLAHYLRRTVAENRFANVAVHQCKLAAEDGQGSGAADLPRAAPLRRLDSVIWGAVNFIRIAADGAERRVFDGADLILSRDRPIVLSALDDERLREASGISGAEYLRSFRDLEYDLRQILPGGRCGDPATERVVAEAGGRLSIACLPAERTAELTAASRW